MEFLGADELHRGLTLTSRAALVFLALDQLKRPFVQHVLLAQVILELLNDIVEDGLELVLPYLHIVDHAGIDVAIVMDACNIG